MATRAEIDAKYSSKPASSSKSSPALKVVQSPYETAAPAGASAKQSIDAKYGSGKTAAPVISTISNMPSGINANSEIKQPVPVKQPTYQVEPLSTFDKIKQKLGFKVEPKVSMVFSTTPESIGPALEKAKQESKMMQDIVLRTKEGANPEVMKFINSFELSTIGGKLLNNGNKGQYAVKQNIDDEYTQSHPSLSVVAKGLGMLTDTIMLGKGGAGFNLSSKVPEVAGPIANLYPTAIRVLGRAAENASIFGIQSFLNESLAQVQRQKFEPGKIAKETASGAGFGAATGGAGAASTYARQITYATAGVAGLSTLEKYLDDGKLTGQDLISIGVNSAVAGLFQAVQGRGSAQRFKDEDFDRLEWDQLVTRIQGNSGSTRAEAEKMAIVLQTLPRSIGETFKTKAQIILKEKLPTFERMPAVERFEISQNVAKRVAAGESLPSAFEAEVSNAALGVNIPQAQTTVQPKTATEVIQLTNQPMDKKVVERIQNLTGENQVTFAREIENNIRETLNAPASADNSKNSKVVLKNEPLQSGAPAHFTKDGKIEVSLPQLAQDLKVLISGGRIAAHTNSPYATLFQKKEGESVQELTTRYISEVLLHEKAHQITITVQDQQKLDALEVKVQEATQAGNEKGVQAAKTALEKFGQELENKANQYLTEHRAQMQVDFLPQVESVLNKFGQIKAQEKAKYLESIKQLTESKFKQNKKKAKVQEKVTQARENERARKQTTIQKIKAKATQKLKEVRDQMRAEKYAKVQKEKAKATQKLKEVRDQMRAEKYAKVQKEKAAVASQYQAAIDKINDRATSVQDRKQELFEYAKLVPASARGKFLGAIKNTSSQKEFLEVLDRMRKATRAVERKQLMQEIVKELRSTKAKKQDGIVKGKFTAEVQRRLDKIRENIYSSYEIARAKRNDLIAAFRDIHGDAPLDSFLLSDLEDLAMQGIKEMDPKELRYTLDNIQSLKESGRTKNELAKFNRETRIQAIQDKVFEVLTGGQELPSSKSMLPERQKTKVRTSIKNFFTWNQYGWEELLDSLSKLDRGTKPYQSFISKFGVKAHRANSSEFAGQTLEIKKGDTAIRRIYGLKKNSEVLNFINEMNVAIKLGQQLNADGVSRDLTITRGEAMYFTALMENPNLAETFEAGMQWTDQIKQLVREQLSDKDMQMVEWLMKDLQDYYPSINEIYARENFVDLPFDEKYFPLYRQVEKVQKKEADAGSVAALLSDEAKYYASVKNGSLKSRTQNAVPIEPKNIIDVWYTHKIKMEHYKAWAGTMYEYRRIFGNPEVRQAIKDFHGQGAVKVIDGFLNDMARGGVDSAKIYNIIDKARVNVTRSILGLNFKVSLRQFIGILNYAIELPARDFFAGVLDFYASPLAKGKFLYENSPILQERFGEGYERDIKYALQAGYKEKLSKAHNFSEAMFFLIRNADKLTVMPGSWAAYRSKYNELIRTGSTPAEAKAGAMEYAELLTNRVQETSQLDTLSALQREGSFMKLLTMFQSQPGKFWRIAANSVRNLRAGRGSKAENLKRLAMVWFILPMLWQFAVDGFKFNKKNQLQTAILGPFSYPLIIGQFLQSVAGWAAGGKYGYSASPVLGIADDVKNAVQQLSQGDVVEGVTYLIDLMGKASGVPTGIVTKPIRKGLKDASDSPTANPAVKF